ncbi:MULTISPECIES: diguanylate cyclase domain-containing protein [unclassified Nostoc]|uniref:diguanylate cyclase domain-containing protein n=1 Tax=unclassified Nostoc TaxID=2593658 RepID=UPI002AD3A3DC|nr:diguanylate cyclase [Nostoc sp. DedQUE03]MDZ7973384.1 diguanylate cyclase [Nostoc sp. DedQUE03]MDZ8045341.1 diguanylate cyclase [Nostoc sp. DedQUE02]
MFFNRVSGNEISLEQIIHQIRKLTVRIHQSFELVEILKVVVTEVRTTLDSDRTIIYRFLPNGDGVVVEESVNPEWMPIQGQLIYDPCFNAQWVKQYQQGRIGVIEDIDTKPLAPCYKQLLTKLQIRANLVVPILVNNQKLSGNSTSSPQLWGLLITHQCSSPRQWSCLEIEFLQLVATQLGIALQQSAIKERQRVEDELRWQQALLRSMTDTSLLGFYVVDNRTDKILYFNDRFCEIWGIKHLKTQMQIGELKNNDIIPDCLPLIADLTAFAESCKPLQSEENRSIVEDEILFVDGRTIRRFSSQIRDIQDRYFGRLYIFEDISDRLRTEIALRESEERYRSVITAMAEGIVLQQADGCITACNERAEKILGLNTEQMMGRTSIDPRWRAIHEDGTPFPGENHPAIVTLHTGQPQFNVVMGVHKPDGSLTWISINSQPLFRLNELKPYAVVASFTDITARKQIELALQNQAERERMVFAIAQHIRQSLDLDEILNTTVADVRHFLQTDRVIIYRLNSNWSGTVITESVAEGWKSILNMEITDTYFVETQGQSYQQGTIKVTPDIYIGGLTACHLELLEQLQVRAKLVVPILQGDGLWGLLIAHHCRAPREWQLWESELLKQLATQVAIAIQQSQLCQQLQLANQQLENLAMVDQLTQIANRRVFDINLNHIWHDLLRKKSFLSLLLCDIDYFKQYNDTYGHAAGDTCLTLVAQTLKRTVKRSTDLVARYGGEEFAVILPDSDRNGAIRVAKQIHEAIQQMNISHTASPVKQCITLSIGIAAVIPVTDLVTLDLIKAADQALYQAKAQGRNRSFVDKLYF